MKIKILEGIYSPFGNLKKNDIVDIPNLTAGHWIKAGIAEEVKIEAPKPTKKLTSRKKIESI